MVCWGVRIGCKAIGYVVIDYIVIVNSFEVFCGSCLTNHLFCLIKSRVGKCVWACVTGGHRVELAFSPVRTRLRGV